MKERIRQRERERKRKMETITQYKFFMAKCCNCNKLNLCLAQPLRSHSAMSVSFISACNSPLY
jgi:hypothetical protein